MRYLIDSDWVIAHLRGRSDVARRIYDLYTRRHWNQHRLHSRTLRRYRSFRRASGCTTTLDRFIETFEIVGLNEPICELFGRERARLRIAGRLIGDFDLLIGCTAVYCGMRMLTNNRRHFERIAHIRIESF